MTQKKHIPTAPEVLIERYFDASATPQEEASLRAFLISEEGADSRYDEVRAVMSYMAMGRKIHAPQPQRQAAASRVPMRRKWNYAAAAAIAVFILGSALWLPGTIRQDNVCIAYVGGQKITQPDAVVSAMFSSLEAVSRPDEVPAVDQQLEDMFGTLDE